MAAIPSYTTPLTYAHLLHIVASSGTAVGISSLHSVSAMRCTHVIDSVSTRFVKSNRRQNSEEMKGKLAPAGIKARTTYALLGFSSSSQHFFPELCLPLDLTKFQLTHLSYIRTYVLRSFTVQWLPLLPYITHISHMTLGVAISAPPTTAPPTCTVCTTNKPQILTRKRHGSHGWAWCCHSSLTHQPSS